MAAHVPCAFLTTAPLRPSWSTSQQRTCERPAARRPRARVTAGVDSVRAPTLPEALARDVRAGELPTAVWRLEAAARAGAGGGMRAVLYRDVHALVGECARREEWALALRALAAVEGAGLPLKRSTCGVVLACLARAGRVFEAQALLERLWTPALPLVAGGERSLTEREAGRRRPDEKMVVLVANAAVEAGRVDIAAKLVRQMEASGMRASLFSICVLVKGYGRECHVDGIIKALKAVRERGLEPDLVLYNAAIDAYVRCGEHALAGKTLRDIDHSGMRPTARSYNPILRSLAKSGKVDEAFRMRKDMERRGIEVSPVTLNALIHACVMAKDWAMAGRVLKEAMGIGQTDELGTGAGLTRDLCVAFTSVISGLAREGDITGATALMEDLARRVGRSNLQAELELEIGIAVTAVISALLEQSEVVRAWMLFRSVRKRFRVRLPPDTYNAVIRGLARRGDTVSVDAASRVFEEMLAVFSNCSASGTAGSGGHSIHASPSNAASAAASKDIVLAYNSIMDGFVRSGNTSSAENLLVRMRESGLIPSAVTYTTIINGYGKEHDLIAARRLFQQMRQVGLSADRVTMNSFIGACVRVGDMELAIRIFDEMQRVGGRLSPNLTTYSALIGGHVRSNDVTAAWDTYEDMKAVGIVPNERVLDRLMAACVSPDLKPDRWQVLSESGTKLTADEQSFRDNEGAEDGCGGGGVGSRPGDVANTAPIQLPLRRRRPRDSGWTSDRALVLLEDMERCKCSDLNKRRWRRAIESIWAF